MSGVRGEAIQRASIVLDGRAPEGWRVGVVGGVDAVLGLVCERVEALPRLTPVHTEGKGIGLKERPLGAYLTRADVLALLRGGADQ